MPRSILRVAPAMLHCVAFYLPGGVTISGSTDEGDDILGIRIEGDSVPDAPYSTLLVEKIGARLTSTLVASK